MKKKITCLITGFGVLCLSVVAHAQIPVNSVTSSHNVVNASNAADADASSYAVLQAPIGLLSFAEITLGYEQLGIGGMRCLAEIQSEGGLLDATALKSLDITLYNSSGKVVGQRTGDDFVNAEVLNSSDRVKLYVGTKNSANNIASVKIRVNGVANLINAIRLYSANLGNECERIRGNDVFGSGNVQNAANAISEDKHDFALLAPPLLGGTAFIDLAFGEDGAAGKPVKFLLGEGNNVLNLALLQNMTVKLYDAAGATLLTKSDFKLADALVLDEGRFALKVETNAGGNAVHRARITLSSLVSLLTTVKVYNVSHASGDRPDAAEIVVKADAAHLCKGDSIKLRIGSNANTDNSFQWYRNGTAIDGATGTYIYAKKDGEYCVVKSRNGCLSYPSKAVTITTTNCVASPDATATHIQAYPNPFNAYTLVSFGKTLATPAYITVTDKTGHITEQYQLAAGASSVKVLANAAKGIYFIKITTPSFTATKTVEKL